MRKGEGVRPPRAQWVAPSRPTITRANIEPFGCVSDRSGSARGHAEQQPGRLCSPNFNEGIAGVLANNCIRRRARR